MPTPEELRALARQRALDARYKLDPNSPALPPEYTGPISDLGQREQGITSGGSSQLDSHNRQIQDGAADVTHDAQLFKGPAPGAPSVGETWERTKQQLGTTMLPKGAAEAIRAREPRNLPHAIEPAMKAAGQLLPGALEFATSPAGVAALVPGMGTAVAATMAPEMIKHGVTEGVSNVGELIGEGKYAEAAGAGVETGAELGFGAMMGRHATKPITRRIGEAGERVMGEAFKNPATMPADPMRGMAKGYGLPEPVAARKPRGPKKGDKTPEDLVHQEVLDELRVSETGHQNLVEVMRAMERAGDQKNASTLRDWLDNEAYPDPLAFEDFRQSAGQRPITASEADVLAVQFRQRGLKQIGAFGGEAPPTELPPPPPVPPEPKTRKSNINFDYRTEPQDITLGIESAAAEIRRRRIPLNELRQEAKEGISLEDAEIIGKASLENVSKTLAVRQASNAIDYRYEAAQKRWKAIQEKGTIPEIEAASVEKAKAQEAMLRGLRASSDVAHAAGLTLRSMQMRVEGDVPLRASKARRNLDSMLQALEQKKPERALRLKEELLQIDLTDPVMLEKILRTNHPHISTWGDKIHEYRISNVLSALATQSRNLTGNVLLNLAKTPEDFLAAGFELRRGSNRELLFGEAGMDLLGFANGTHDAFMAFATTLKENGGALAESKFDVVEAGKAHGPAIAGVKGTIIRSPLTLLQAVDRANRTLTGRATAYAVSYRVAVKELGLRGKNAIDEATKMVTDSASVYKPRKLLKGETIADLMEREADYRTAQSELGPFAKKVMPVREVALFRKTPVNLVKLAFERSPLNALRILTKAGTGKYKGKPTELSTDLARMTLGTIVWTTAYLYASSDMLTGGGPIDKKERENWIRNGGVPYTMTIGKRKIPYAWAEPFGSLLATAADFKEIYAASTSAERKEIQSLVARSFMRNVTDKTWLQGVLDMADALSDPVANAPKLLGSVASTFVPGSAAVASVARLDDPYMRQARGFIDQIKTRIPGLRKQVMPVRDIRGKRVESAIGQFRREKGDLLAIPVGLASPAIPAPIRGGKIEAMIEKMGARLPGLQRRISASESYKDERGKKITNQYVHQLEPDEFDMYQQFSGNEVNEVFEMLEKDPDHPFWSLPPDSQELDLQVVVRKAHETARQDIVSWLLENGRIDKTHAEVFQKSVEKALSKANASGN